MERYKCKFCMNCYANDEALSIHIRSSHVMNFPDQMEDIESASSWSSEEEKSLLYGLRENNNPKKSVDAGSIVVESESESESSKNPTRRRSKRIRKHSAAKSLSRGESSSRASSVVSDATTEEDVAFVLMMLSRDKWTAREEGSEEMMLMTELETDESEDLNHSNKKLKSRASRAKYKCETCKKVFKSYQALGGHRASHKKMKSYGAAAIAIAAAQEVAEIEIEAVNLAADRKIHECPVCFRGFSSGQALGGHKRSHVTGAAVSGSAAVRNLTRSSSATAEKMIDLNLPAPMEDDEMSQLELSAVSDVEFLHALKR